MSKHGTLHMDPSNVRNLANLLGESAAALEALAAAAPAERDTRALHNLAKRARMAGEIMGSDFWTLLEGEDAKWVKMVEVMDEFGTLIEVPEDEVGQMDGAS